MRVVLDTNVIISALLWKGEIKSLFDHIESGRLTLCLTPLILSEINRVLQYPKILKQLALAGIQHETVVQYVATYAMLFPDVQLVHLISVDPSDDVFLNCALASNARWIVSGDAHLLKLARFEQVTIVTPKQFLQML